MKKIYKIEPILEARVWGGQKLREYFGYRTNLPNIAEVYHVIAIPGHLDCRVEETGEYLSAFFHNHRELFGCRCPDMPVRLVSANAKGKLSYHLHPTDEYALEHEGMRGKVEGGIYFTGAGTGRSVLGHHARTLEEFKKMVEEGDWEHLLRYVEVKKNQYCHTPIGTLHGEEGSGEEINVAWSTNGDVTYRIYDHGRNDNSRPLHIQQVYDNIRIPDDQCMPLDTIPVEKDGCVVYNYFEEKGSYTAIRIQVEGEGEYQRKEFMFMLCIDGKGRINGVEITPGQTVFIPCESGKLRLQGDGYMDLCVLSYADKED